MSEPAQPDLGGKTILQIIPDLSAGGAERTTLEMAEAIVAAGGTALVISEGGRMLDALEAAGGENIRLNVSTKNPFKVLSNAGKIAKIIEQRGVDLVHARSRAPAWSAYWAARRTQTPFVTTYHGAYSGVSGLKKFYNSVMARGELVIANSEWTAAHVRSVHEIANERIVTIPRGVDFAQFDPERVSAERVKAMRDSWNIPADDKRLTMTLPGRLTAWKGQRVAIEALARLTGPEREGLHLVLPGDAQGRTSYVEDLEALIDAEGLGEQVSIVGHCEDMPAAYLASDIVLAPSSRPEAFGRVAAEASAMGKPVIVADHGGQREIVVEGETGARVAPGNAAELAGAIRAMLQLGPDGRASMGKAGQEWVRARFSKEGLQAATLNVYNQLLEKREDS
ncbi:glycosyltransferase family 4 protein [Henriciella litoralis]|uniref:glycosyltransferase family 4 protein n=1 Tax=Henriciella litoralis TaxID=568102 RepID=UPI000A0651DA|nr:glycosyltransferase family 4 protein [Henriciella litoralis]